VRRLPPGRMARLWLGERIEVATRGVHVLEQKAHALVRQRRRLRQHVEETGETWKNALLEADRWFLRAVAIGGSEQLELILSRMPGDAEVRVRWRSLMGVVFPGDVEARTPSVDHIGAVARSAALAPAAAAYRKAVSLALDHAAATRALELVEEELALVRRRLRGLDDRWLPRLRRKLHEVELALSEEEREDMVRSSWTAKRKGRRP